MPGPAIGRQRGACDWSLRVRWGAVVAHVVREVGLESESGDHTRDDERDHVVDGLGLEVPDASAANAARAREHASELAAEKGVTLPSDIWGVREQAEAASTGG